MLFRQAQNYYYHIPNQDGQAVDTIAVADC